MKRGSCFTISNFICQDCEMIIPLPRCHGRQREHGHIKDLWCPCCKKKSKFKEIKYKEIYKTLAGDVLIA